VTYLVVFCTISGSSIVWLDLLGLLQQQTQLQAINSNRDYPEAQDSISPTGAQTSLLFEVVIAVLPG
jgi:hypothetical protein